MACWLRGCRTTCGGTCCLGVGFSFGFWGVGAASALSVTFGVFSVLVALAVPARVVFCGLVFCGLPLVLAAGWFLSRIWRFELEHWLTQCCFVAAARVPHFAFSPCPVHAHTLPPFPSLMPQQISVVFAYSHRRSCGVKVAALVLAAAIPPPAASAPESVPTQNTAAPMGQGGARSCRIVPSTHRMCTPARRSLPQGKPESQRAGRSEGRHHSSGHPLWKTGLVCGRRRVLHWECRSSTDAASHRPESPSLHRCATSL